MVSTVETYYLFSLFSNGPLSYRALNIDNIMSSLSHDYTTRLVQGSRNVKNLDGVKHMWAPLLIGKGLKASTKN